MIIKIGTILYLHSVAEFAQHFRKPPDQLGPEDIRQYQPFLMKEKQVSLSSYIQMVCALRFFFTHAQGRLISTLVEVNPHAGKPVRRNRNLLPGPAPIAVSAARHSAERLGTGLDAVVGAGRGVL